MPNEEGVEAFLGQRFHDYKTGSKLPDQAELDKDRQLALYQIGVQKLWPDVKEARLIWHLVAFDVEMRSMRTPAALDVLKKEIWDLCPVKKMPKSAIR